MLLLALTLALAPADVDSADAHPRNRPPRLEVHKALTATVGAELVVSLTASDPDGDILTFGAEGLPADARFETRTGDLIWTPRPEDVGTHVLTFSATDGQATAYALTRIIVGARQHLALQIQQRDAVVEVGKSYTQIIAANVPDPDVQLDVSGLPAHASYDPTAHLFVYLPTDDDLGDHVIKVRISSKDENVDAALTVHVRPAREEWMSYALPGVGYSAYAPLGAAADIGLAHGPSFELVVVQWVHRNDNMGPSHGRISLRADLLFPLNDPANPAIIYAAGVALSLERNPERSFLLPFFGVDVGGLYQKQLGNAFQVTPSIGVHLFQNRNIFITADVGYLLALPDLERLHGPRASLSGNFTLW